MTYRTSKYQIYDFSDVVDYFRRGWPHQNLATTAVIIEKESVVQYEFMKLRLIKNPFWLSKFGYDIYSKRGTATETTVFQHYTDIDILASTVHAGNRHTI